MISLALIFLPCLAALLVILLKKYDLAYPIALGSSCIACAISVIAYFNQNNFALTEWQGTWLPSLGASFHIGMQGVGMLMCLLTTIAFPLILISTNKIAYKNSTYFYALMLLAQAGVLGVFLAKDALLFYFFWELVLIPVYFLIAIWGGEKRIAVSFTFFIYTFIGSLFMLVGLIYLYLLNPMHSFDIDSLYAVILTEKQQSIIFWLLFIGFAVKIPIFPLHSWQADTYATAPIAVTMILSGLMVKMGLFAILRWLFPIVPLAVVKYSQLIIILSLITIVYASFLAWVQQDMKRLIAYSSLAHLGLITAALFTLNTLAIEGAMIQFFFHGINVIALWIGVGWIENQLQSTDLNSMGGLAKKAPIFTLFFMIAALANIAIPLTNAFIGEFLMVNGIFQYNKWYAVICGVGIIFSAVYTLLMVQKIFYGNTSPTTMGFKDIGKQTQLVLLILTLFIFFFGVYPQPLLTQAKGTIDTLILELLLK